MAESMEYPGRLEDFLKSYSFRDEKEVYTNGSELIQLFRVKQAIDHYRPVVHAHWIEEEDCTVVSDRPWSMCSACGEYSPKLLYCAFCGAIMDEEV